MISLQRHLLDPVSRQANQARKGIDWRETREKMKIEEEEKRGKKDKTRRREIFILSFSSPHLGVLGCIRIVPL